MAYDADAGYPPLAFQIPAFVCANTPTLAPGGGAEVLPASLLSDDPFLHSWFSNNGFTPRPTLESQYSSDEVSLNDSSRIPPQPAALQPTSAPFDFDSGPSSVSVSTVSPQTHLHPISQSEISALLLPRQTPSLFPQQFFSLSNLAAPSPLGLPVYSTSGFDLLSILARVANRPHPRVLLGPVDMTCSFVVVDVRRFDHPIVYCSPSFCHLTGYSEAEVIGRNCRFLQAPNGNVRRGDPRLFTQPTAVAHLRKNLGADKECQTSITNYKKDGTAFMNLVTVIPISGGVSGALHEESEIVYHVGFQVDLTEQPNAILDKLRDGTYIVDSAPPHPSLVQQQPLHIPLNLSQSKDRKSQVIPSLKTSRDLRRLLSDPTFVKSIPITSSTTVPLPQPSSSVRSDFSLSGLGNNQLLHLMLLEASPDFILVVSLKGNFLYVAPSVRRVLGYQPEEMVGRSVSDYAHPEDVVPLMRELKEGSATGLAAATAASADISASISDQTPAGMQITPRTVDLLFRARTKVRGAYIWIECKGRLHVEPGKGRKAIVLSGRAREMPGLKWQSVAWGGGLSIPPRLSDSSTRHVETEVWGMMSNGQSSGGVVSFLVVGPGMMSLLGWSPPELVGREVVEFIADGANVFLGEVRELLAKADVGGGRPRRVCCKMRHKNGMTVNAILILFRPSSDSSTQSIKGVIQAPLIYQLRSVQSFQCHPPSSLIHSSTSDIFEEFDTDRDTSWQYELQQIRYANQRLEEEISSLKKQLGDTKGVEQKVLHGLQQQQQQQRPSPLEHFVHPSTTTTSTITPPARLDYAVADHHHHHSYSASREPDPPHFETTNFVVPHHHHHQQHHHHAHQGYNSAGSPSSSFIPQPDMMGSSSVSSSTRSQIPFSHGWDAAAAASSFYFQNQNKNSLKRSWDVARCG